MFAVARGAHEELRRFAQTRAIQWQDCNEFVGTGQKKLKLFFDTKESSPPHGGKVEPNLALLEF